MPLAVTSTSNLYRDIAIDVYIVLAPAHLSSNAYNFGGGVSLLTKNQLTTCYRHW